MTFSPVAPIPNLFVPLFKSGPPEAITLLFLSQQHWPFRAQTFEKFDKQPEEDRPPDRTPNPFVQIFKIWSPGRAKGGKGYEVK
jgi:hypothetical protein